MREIENIYALCKMFQTGSKIFDYIYIKTHHTNQILADVSDWIINFLLLCDLQCDSLLYHIPTGCFFSPLHIPYLQAVFLSSAALRFNCFSA